MQKITAQNMFDDLIKLGQNIARIYEKLVICSPSSEEFQNQLEHLEMALEVEENIYQKIDKKELEGLLSYFESKYQILNVTPQEIKIKIPDTLMPHYRIYFYLTKLKQYWQEASFGTAEIFFDIKVQKQIKKMLKENELKGMLLNLQFYLNYANIHHFTDPKTKQNYYKLIYLDRILESELLHDSFPIIPLEDTLYFAQRALFMFEMKQKRNPELIGKELEESIKDIFFQYQENEIISFLKRLLNKKEIPSYMEENYLLACFFSLPSKKKMRIFQEVITLINNPQIPIQEREMILIYYQKILEIIKENQLKKDEKKLKRR